jgi:hypothetical protein
MGKRRLSLESLCSRVKTRVEVAGEYGITPKTLKSRLRKSGLNIPPGSLFPGTLRRIYQTLGKTQGFNTKEH